MDMISKTSQVKLATLLDYLRVKDAPVVYLHAPSVGCMGVLVRKDIFLVCDERDMNKDKDRNESDLDIFKREVKQMAPNMVYHHMTGQQMLAHIITNGKHQSFSMDMANDIDPYYRQFYRQGEMVRYHEEAIMDIPGQPPIFDRVLYVPAIIGALTHCGFAYETIPGSVDPE